MLSRAIIDQILLGPILGMRFTQDSAILPEVWTALAQDPERRVPLLLTPYRNDAAGRLAQKIANRLDADDGSAKKRARRRDVAYVDAVVAVNLSLDELLNAVLPITEWWETHSKKLTTEFGQGWLTQEMVAAAIGKVLNDPDGWAADAPVPDDVARILTLVGLIAAERELENEDTPFEELLNTASGRRTIIKKALEGIANAKWLGRLRQPPTQDAEAPERVFLVSLNRPVYPAVERSVSAIKADAAMRLFSIDTRDIRWAIIDSGIDAQHPAFIDEEGKASRVEQIFDFNRVRSMLCIDRIEGEEARRELADELAPECGLAPARIMKILERVSEDVKLGRAVDWNLIKPLLQRTSDSPPYTDHGTHVAGILAAGDHHPDVAKRGNRGVCPNIRVYDLRVLSSTIEETEFAVISALQFVRFLNETSGYKAIHGVNLSLSIPHDVRNYACGRTPVCEEATRLALSGVVVVAAAGNLGWQPGEGTDSAFARYNAISITDPGNADGVITVGATHRYKPHTYGVSYFSSRGPTGDGRNKPDLVAPGEKIRSTLPDEGWGVKDGTSMAAPHVSGAAALLMGRYGELVGDPARIKRILCESATDLGRERYFQGAGMVDVLRALQSV
jgi:serine protease AprX